MIEMHIDEVVKTIGHVTGKELNFIGEPIPKSNKVAPFSKAFPFQGVYFFFDSDLNLIYIGGSKLMRYRIRDHLCSNTNTKWIRNQFAFAGFIKCQDNEVFEIESQLIKAIKPIGNKQIR
ncbi:TPA: GIY-YIG nuclease family protein [Bacillus cereus]|nr:GIY-YIG nuclease family protein [Bacillus cereus]